MCVYFYVKGAALWWIVVRVETSFSRLFTPGVSIVLRGVVYSGLLLVALLLCIVGNVYVGVKPFIIENMLVSLGYSGELSLVITCLFVFGVVLVAFLVLTSRYGLVMGYIRSTIISSIIFLLTILGITWYRAVRVEGIGLGDAIATVFLVSFLVLLAILDRKYPYVAVAIDTSKLSKEYLATVKVYGNTSSFVLEIIPVNSFEIRGPFKTIYANYYELRYMAGKKSSIIMKYKDVELGRISISELEPLLKQIVFRAYVNDDNVGVYEYSVELTKTLDVASEPIIRAVSAKIGIEPEQIREVLFFDSNGASLDPKTYIKDLDTDEVHVKIYFTEPYMEILKYYRKESIISLWDKLMKRIEIYGGLIDDLSEKLDKAVVRLANLSVNWW